MQLTHKERLRRAIYKEKIDYLPTQINYTEAMGKKIATYYNIQYTELPFFLNNHLIRVDLSYSQSIDKKLGVRYDWWGVGHDLTQEGYYLKINPLAESPDLDKYPWPNPNELGLMDKAKNIIENYGHEYFIVPNIGFALFERAWSLRGLEQFMMDTVLNQGFAVQLLDIITEIQLVLINRFIDLGVDGGYFGDDYGAQKNLLISTSSWRKLIKPRLARMFEPFINRGLPIIMHSDGQIQNIIPDLIEIGVTVLNPVQPEVIDHKWIYQNFGDKLSFYGGISTQTTLPFGTPDDVIKAVERCINDLAPNNTGLMLSSHRLMTDIPMNNFNALLTSLHIGT
jgi:uroporphyrinogen decarboxylase